MFVDIKATINKVCNEMCGCNREDCKWTAYGEHEGCSGIQELEEYSVNVEAIPINWIEEKIKLMKQDCELKEAEVIQSLVYWWRVEQNGWR